MKLSNKANNYLVNELKRHEGSKKNSIGQHIVYKCPAGYNTLGYGHNLDANPLQGINLGSVITEDKALQILNKDIDNSMSTLDTAFPWVIKLDEARYTALVNMTFNMGIGTLRTFKNSMGLMAEGKYKEASVNFAKSIWYKQVGKRAVEICIRIETGEFK